MNKKQQKVTISREDYERILAMMESDPIKARQEMRSVINSGLVADFYAENGRVTFGEIAARHEHMDSRRLPIFLEAWGIIRPFYNPERKKQFRYFCVNAGLVDKMYEDSSVRELSDPNELNADKNFIDKNGKIHRMKMFTKEGANFISQVLVEHGYKRIDAPAPKCDVITPEESAQKKLEPVKKPFAPVEKKTPEVITFNAVELAGLALVVSEVVPLNGLRSMLNPLKRAFNDVEFDVNSDDLFVADQHYIVYDTTDKNAIMLKRGDDFYQSFHDAFFSDSAKISDKKKEVATRIQKAMIPIMEGWKE